MTIVISTSNVVQATGMFTIIGLYLIGIGLISSGICLWRIPNPEIKMIGYVSGFGGIAIIVAETAKLLGWIVVV